MVAYTPLAGRGYLSSVADEGVKKQSRNAGSQQRAYVSCYTGPKGAAMEYLECLHAECAEVQAEALQAACPWLTARQTQPDGVVVFSTEEKPMGFWEAQAAFLNRLGVEGSIWGWGRRRRANAPGIVVMPKPHKNNPPPGMTVVSKRATFRTGPIYPRPDAQPPDPRPED